MQHFVSRYTHPAAKARSLLSNTDKRTTISTEKKNSSQQQINNFPPCPSHFPFYTPSDTFWPPFKTSQEQKGSNEHRTQTRARSNNTLRSRLYRKLQRSRQRSRRQTGSQNREMATGNAKPVGGQSHIHPTLLLLSFVHTLSQPRHSHRQRQLHRRQRHQLKRLNTSLVSANAIVATVLSARNFFPPAPAPASKSKPGRRHPRQKVGAPHVRPGEKAGAVEQPPPR